MSYQDRLREEINAKLDALMVGGEPWIAKWVTHEICASHGDGLKDGQHGEFWQHAGYINTRREVTSCINRRAGDKTDREGEQIILPGYEHLHAYYVVRREGEDIGVPVAAMTEEERFGKIALYRSMGAACYAHADELEKFGTDRQIAA